MAFQSVRGWPVSRILSRVPVLRRVPLDDHSSAAPVTRAVKLPTRASGLKRPCGGLCPALRPWDRPFHVRPLFGIAPGGACHTVPVARSVVGSYPTVSPSPWIRRPRSLAGLAPAPGQSLLCGAFPEVAPAGDYPAPLLHGVRTFLGAKAPRSSSHPREGGLTPLAPARQPFRSWVGCVISRTYAVSPFGSANPLARQQAVRVLARRQAMVIGPTPPGTGVMAPATAAALA